jgi:CheY-like chemotaxis protein
MHMSVAAAKGTVLVIEEQPLLRDNIIDLLEASYLKTLTAEDGVKGVDLAKTYQPNLILCEVRIPELDGYSVLKTLRQDPETAEIPLILLSTMRTETDLLLAKELGANGYFVKPFASKELLEAIQMQLI